MHHVYGMLTGLPIAISPPALHVAQKLIQIFWLVLFAAYVSRSRSADSTDPSRSTALIPVLTSSNLSLNPGAWLGCSIGNIKPLLQAEQPLCWKKFIVCSKTLTQAGPCDAKPRWVYPFHTGAS